MERHPFFDLLMHTDRELESMLNASILERTTLHEWPLSCVQRLTLPEGMQWIYKSQSGPTVEAEFYSQARSALLIRAETIYQDGFYACMLLEHLNAPRLGDLEIPEERARQIGKQLIKEISHIEGTLPAYLDVSTWAKWSNLISEMVRNLYDLITRGSFRVVTKAEVEQVEKVANSKPLRAAICGPSCLNHHDLGGDNIFLLPDGSLRVVDWQRPIRGPWGLDLAQLAESLGYPPTAWVDSALNQVMTLLRIYWFTECTLRWFPPGTEAYDKTIAGLVNRLQLVE